MIIPTIPVLALETSTINNDAIIKQLNKHFEIYFNSLETLSKPDYTNIIEKNSNTKIYTTATELHVEQNKLGNLSYQNINFTLNIDNININDDTATVNLKMKSTYNYSTVPNFEANISDVAYTFKLDKKSDQWLISMIDTNNIQLITFINSVKSQILSQRSNIASTSIDISIDNIKQDFLENAQLVAKNLSGEENSDKTPKQMKIEPRYTSYPYNASKGIAYAKANAEKINTNFYSAPESLGNCTNFVSQSLWAAYGGVNSGISSGSRMTSRSSATTGWFAGSGGGSSAWEGVDALWNRVVNSYPGNGPNGTGYNNNRPYYDFAPGRIYNGEILQFRNGSSGKYTHSVYVVGGNNANNKYYNEIIVAQRTSNNANRNLWEAIMSYGGNSCYMRDIAFTSANLNP